jgi:hypothetical protein
MKWYNVQTLRVPRSSNCHFYKYWITLNVRQLVILCICSFQSTPYYTAYSGRDSSLGTETSYGLDDRGGRSSSPGRVKNFYLHVVQAGSGVHTTSYAMGTRDSFPGVKRARREADHSPPAGAEVKKM